MGKGGRIACIFTPMALTIASFVALIILEASGWSPKSSLNNNYLMSADFSNFTTTDLGDSATNADLTAALQLASSTNSLENKYQIYLWSYCTAEKKNSGSELDWCSKRSSSFVFDPVEAFGMNATKAADAATGTSSSDNAIQSAISNVKDNFDDWSDKVLGDSATEAIKVYKRVAKWNSIAYQVAFWTTLGTILVSILAIFSRWGSLLTWILAIVSSLFTFAASLTTTVLFSTLSGALKGLLNPYKIKVDVGTRALAITWIATAFSIVATLFWLFSVCCCSGKSSNPHNKSNKGGLWNAEPKGYNDNRHSGMSLGKSGTGYARVGSPGHGGDRVPLAQYPQQPTAYQSPMPYGGGNPQHSNGFEPYRQQQQQGHW
ncbi:hypothetical protein E2P81_ATG10547 [Venturia nashicola]|nr:hypothetical protein E2P81_ATG10547 [Venturia nashicola]